MAKLPFSKLNLSKDIVKTNEIEWNEQTITVKSYLPVEEKFNFIEAVLDQAADKNNFLNPLKVKIFFTIEIINFYTNITFTEKQKEDPQKLYDLICGNGFFDAIVKLIPEKEYNDIWQNVLDTGDSIYKYRNSVMGILENIVSDYSGLDLEASNIQKKLSDPNNIQLLRDVLTKLG